MQSSANSTGRPRSSANLTATGFSEYSGFGLPFVTLLPSPIVGALSLPVLPFAIAALYWQHLAGGWRRVFVTLSVVALYFIVFVLLAQLFQKIPILAALAPNPQAPAFAVTPLLALVLVAVLGRAAVKGFRNVPAGRLA